MSIAYRRVAGIDPGATTGLVALTVPVSSRPIDAQLTGARWLNSTQLSIPSAQRFTDAENDARLFEAIRDWLRQWQVESIALEEPWDVFKYRVQARGTEFGLGKTYGLALAAARDVGARVMSYPVTSADARMQKGTKRARLVEARVGWMPTFRSKGGALMVQDRDITLAELHELSAALRRAPASGLLVSASTRLPVLSEDERMALGVLRYHLARLPFIV